MNTIGERLRYLRSEILKMSQAEFGEIFKMKANSISSIENNVNKLTDKNISAICKEFNINEEWLRNGEGDIRPPRTRNEEIQDFANKTMESVDDDFKKRFILALSKLEEQDWNTLKKIAEELNKED